MVPFFIFLLLILNVWLLLQWLASKDRLDEFESRLTQLQYELRRFKSAQREASEVLEPDTPPPPPVSARFEKVVAPEREEFVRDITRATEAENTPAPPPIIPPPLTAEPNLAQSPVSPKPITQKQPAINWENFLGVKLFAWVGGLALFLGVAFFVKYSFDNNLISPQVRVAIGYLVGAGLIGGGLWLSRERHAVTVQTLCATGTLILYANIFASHAYYRLFGTGPAFALMVLVTAGAFFLAVHLDAQVVAILGLLGGFLTPPLLSTGVDKAPQLFSYLGLLDVGLLAIALRKRWHYLAFFAAASTVLMQIGWVLRFFVSEKIFIALSIFLAFVVIFETALIAAQHRAEAEKWLCAAALLMPAVALGFVFHLFVHPYPELAQRAVLLFSFVFMVDLAFLVIAWVRQDLRSVSFAAGGAIFLLLAIWTVRFLNPALLNAALGFYLLFAILHAGYPVFLERRQPGRPLSNWIHIYPAMALCLVLIPLFKMAFSLSFLVWPVVLLLDLVAVSLAILTASLLSILIVFLLTVLATSLWIFQLPAELPALPGMLLIIGGFAGFFMVAAIFTARNTFAKERPVGAEADSSSPPEMFSQVVSLAGLLPFFLLTLVVLRLPLANPAPVFGLAALLLVLFLGVVRMFRVDLLSLTGLISVLLLEYTWQLTRLGPAQVWIAVGWHAALSLALFVFPFLFLRRFQDLLLPWLASALSLPLHFFLFYHAMRLGYPDFPYPGFLPAAVAIPAMAGLLQVVQRIPSQAKARQVLMALFGGAALFFITLIFPIQFERQWLTISWALEGVALLWLFHRVPHAGLRMLGVTLLAVSFARLALNPWVITEYGRTGQPILNWYLYAYGIVTSCLLAGAFLLAPPRHRLGELHAPAFLYTLGTVLAFLLLNIEIADYFSGPGNHLTFNFSASLAQDMIYSLAWGLFAFGLLSIGFQSMNRPTRYAGMGLLVATLLKLFLHDLWRLGGLYRIGSLVGLAILLILVSFIYQRFLGSARSQQGR